MTNHQGLVDEQGKPMLPPDSVLHGVKPYPYDMDKAIRYEVAIEILNDEVGAINGVLYRLEAGAPADPELKDQAEQALTAVVHQRRTLRSNDDVAMDAVMTGARERIAHWNSLAVEP